MCLCCVRPAMEAVVLRTRSAAKVAKVPGKSPRSTGAEAAMAPGRAVLDADCAAVVEEVYVPIVPEAERL